MRWIKSKGMAGILLGVLAMPVFGQQISRSGNKYDQQIKQDVNKLLQNNKKYSKVTATVEDGIVDLSGTVNLYATKAKLEQKVHREDHVAGVRDEMVVAGVSLPDVQLRDQLAEKLRYDRVGFGNTFNNLTIGVENGVATVGGTVRTPVDKDSALSAVMNTPGVKDVVDQVKVAPVSIFDDRIRLAVARAVYGGLPPGYAVDPESPVRIVVQDGKVDLYGVVNSAVDRAVIVSRARSVPGVFSVKDHLMVSKG